jgi:hypothetical protein
MNIFMDAVECRIYIRLLPFSLMDRLYDILEKTKNIFRKVYFITYDILMIF